MVRWASEVGSTKLGRGGAGRGGGPQLGGSSPGALSQGRGAPGVPCERGTLPPHNAYYKKQYMSIQFTLYMLYTCSV